MAKIPKNLRIDEKINDRLKRYAERYKVTETSIIEEAIERYIDVKESEIAFKWEMKTTEPICGVYKITNSINGKTYIGKSSNIRSRVANHFSNGTGQHTPQFSNDLDTYSRYDFDVEILEVCDNEEEALIKEEYYIKKYKSYDPEFGYNRFKKKYLN